VRLRRVLLSALVVLGVLGALGLVVSFPARQILAQRDATAAAAERNAALDRAIAALEARVAALNEPEEVKRLARLHLDLAEPGEESYHVVFPPAGGVPLPEGWPFLIRR
jgi:cell division protein FtsB